VSQNGNVQFFKLNMANMEEKKSLLWTSSLPPTTLGLALFLLSKIHLQSLNLSPIFRMVTVVRKVEITVTQYGQLGQYGHRGHFHTFSADVAYG
jgi:hypothetical protein